MCTIVHDVCAQCEYVNVMMNDEHVNVNVMMLHVNVNVMMNVNDVV